tara:strand:+ start:122 stop:829 length:708 start_codon:yes stop_codon:yes gene_type:complete
MAGITYNTLVTQIRNYTETDSNVLTTDILENIILNAQYRIMRDVPIDSDRKQEEGNLITGQETINAPAGALFIRGIQVYDSTSDITGNNVWLEKKDISYLQEYVPSTETAKRGQPKYYAMFGGATGNTDTTSGRMMFAPVPDTTYKFRVHFNVMPATLESSNQTNYISLNFPNGLLYCCLSETYGFLKGPIDMLTLYENKYKQEVQKFANEQVGRRRRDDYTDGAVRIPVTSANP